MLGKGGDSITPIEFLGAANAATGTSSGSGTIRPSAGAPAGLQAGDIAVGIIGNASTSGTGVPSVPSGWTDSGAGPANTATGEVVNVRIVYRLWSSGFGDDTSYSITSHTNANRVAASRVYFFRGVDNSAPFRGVSFSLGGLFSTGPWQTPEVTAQIGDFGAYGCLIANDVVPSYATVWPYAEPTTDLGTASSTSGSDIGLGLRRRTNSGGVLEANPSMPGNTYASITLNASPGTDGCLFTFVLKPA